MLLSLKIKRNSAFRIFKEIDIKDVDSILIVWNVFHKNDYFKDWGGDLGKVEFIKETLVNMNNKCVSELKLSENGNISLQLLKDLDHAKTKMALLKHQELTKQINEI